MDPDPSSLILLVLLILLSGLFSGSETALFSLSRAKVQSMVAEGITGARLIQALKDRPQKMLVIILMGNNVVNVAATAVATVYFTTYFSSYGLGLVTGVMTLLILVFGEVLPKSIATRFPVKMSQFVIYPLTFVEYTLYPIIWGFEKILTFVVGDHIHSVTEEEVKAMVSMSAEEGSLEKHEQEFIENVLQFNDTSVETIITPRIEIDALEASMTVEEAIAEVNESTHSRFPVYNESIDDIIGFITVKKLLSLSMNDEILTKTLGEIDLYEFIEVPMSVSTYNLFLQFKRKRTHIALVYDEHGGVEGIVTMEDILEEIVGDMLDEEDEADDPIEVVDKNSLIVDGDIVISDLQRALEITLPSFDPREGLNKSILDFLKRFPTVGEAIVIDHVKFVIEEMDGNKITKIKVVKLDDLE